MIVTFNSDVLLSFIKQAKVIKDGFGILIRTINDTELEFIKSDFESQITKSFSCDIQEEGSIVLPKELFPLIKPKTIMTLTHKSINVGKRVIEVDLKDDEAYPIHKDSFEYNVFNLSDKEIKKLLEVEHARSKDKCKPTLQGIHISGSLFIALDGFRLSTRTGNFETEKAFTIKNTKLLKGLRGQVKATVGKNHIKYTINNDLDYIDTLIEGYYLNVNPLIPKDFNCEMLINKGLLESTLKDINNINKNVKDTLVTFNVKNNKCIIKSSSDTVKVTEELDCETTGKEIDIAFNCKYILDAIKDLDNVKMRFTTPVDPALIVDKNNQLELILPVRRVK